MAWLCNLAALVDLGSFYSTNPPLTGKIFSLPLANPSAAPTDTATANTSTLTMTFAATAGTPTGAMGLLIQDPTSPTVGGDFFRCNEAPLPPSPGSLASYTIPAAATSFTTDTLQSMINNELPLRLPLDPDLVRAIGAATGGVVVLNSAAITSLSIKMTPPNMAFTSIGSLTFGPFGAGGSSVTFTMSATLSIQPSHDLLLAERALAIKASSPDFKVIGLDPNVASLLQGWAGDRTAQELEDRLNAVIASQLAPAAAAHGLQLTKTAVASAQRVVIAPGGMTLAIVIADLLGLALVALPITIRIDVAPSPIGRSGSFTHYVVTVTDAKTGKGVSGAQVKLTNFDVSRRTLTEIKPTLDGICRFDATLREKVVPHTGLDVAPSIEVSPTPSSPSFTPQTVTLDLTP
jgi:hypothetical protein